MINSEEPKPSREMTRMENTIEGIRSNIERLNMSAESIIVKIRPVSMPSPEIAIAEEAKSMAPAPVSPAPASPLREELIRIEKNILRIAIKLESAIKACEL